MQHRCSYMYKIEGLHAEELQNVSQRKGLQPSLPLTLLSLRQWIFGENNRGDLQGFLGKKGKEGRGFRGMLNDVDRIAEICDQHLSSCRPIVRMTGRRDPRAWTWEQTFLHVGRRWVGWRSDLNPPGLYRPSLCSVAGLPRWWDRIAGEREMFVRPQGPQGAAAALDGTSSLCVCKIAQNLLPLISIPQKMRD